jgi:tetratricopeptide (TPR) repeat protein
MALGYLAVVHGPDPPADALSRARAAAERALRLDPTLPEAQVALAHLLIFRDWQWEAALRKLDEALEVNPNLAIAHFYKSWVHVFFGRLEQAIAEQERGQELDPLALDWTYLGDLYRLQGRYDLGIAEAAKLLELNPKFPPGHIVLAGIYSDQGKHEQAIAEYDKATGVNPTWKWYAAVGYAKAGQTPRLQNLLSELEQQPVNPWNAYWRATLNALVGNKDEAFRWLNYEPHHDWIPYFRVGDEFKPLRGDPRFLAALKRMNLPPL